ncbi:hypothetical protein OsccyDRAFT_2318 [Leptolyngbyaceae cyanobacterium JSC-12]|nr:hypothetical protein OsccyDRAFT_2318 [Leptolyngbyaceae cyanobacterium JSC-12]
MQFALIPQPLLPKVGEGELAQSPSPKIAILYAKVGETLAVSGLPSSPSPFSQNWEKGS